MYRLRRTHPPDKVVLDNVSLSFFPGAKIGVLGANGAGKSSLLRIMAGLDREFSGDAILAPGATVGLLPQEPDLDPSKDVRGNVEEGVAGSMALLRRFEEIGARLGEVEADEMEALLAEYQEVQDEIERRGAWDIERTLDVAMDALRVPPGDQDVATLSGGERRRVALCRLLLAAPDLLLLDEPTNHLDAESVAWLERFLEEYPGTVVAVTHDRYFLDNVAGWILELDRGKGIPWRGNYSSWLEQKRHAAGAGGEGGVGPPEGPRPRARVGAQLAAGAPGQEQARLASYERLVAEEGARRAGNVEIRIPRPAAGRSGAGGRGRHEGLRRPAADGGPLVLGAARRDRGRHRRQRRRQDDPVPHDRGPGDPRRRAPPPGRHRRAGLRRPVARRPGPRQDGVGGGLRGPGPDPARRPRGDQLARLRRVVQLPRVGPAEAGGPALRAASATACTSPSSWRGAAT